MDNINPQQPQTESRRTELEKLRRELMAEEAVRPTFEEEATAEESLEKGERIVGEPEPSTEQKLMWQEVDAQATNDATARSYLFYLLPISVKTRLASEKTASQIKALGQKYNLGKTKISVVAATIKNLYTVEFNLKDFIRIMQQKLETDPETAKNITKDIANEILAPDKEFLKILHSGS